MKPTIYMALTHDWALRGNGTGDIEQIQFEPMRKLLRIYARAEIRTTFLPDVMQQLRFRQLEGENPELKALADKWDEHVTEAFRRGHDIQLHVHPQWCGATYESGAWKLRSDWSILNYEQSAAYEMLFESKQYLERLLRAANPTYKTIAFRAGALAVAPSNHLLGSLVKLGIELDVSLAAGLHFRTPDIQLDFRDCEETFLPFYPDLQDARKVSERQEQIVCVPLHHFHGSRTGVFGSNLTIAQRKLFHRGSSASESGNAGTEQSNEAAKSKASGPNLASMYEKGIAPLLRRKYLISDTSRLTYPLLKELISSIRRSARDTGLQKVPIVLTNHPKEIVDYAPIERFVQDLAQSEDVRFITLSEIAREISAGEIYVRQAKIPASHHS